MLNTKTLQEILDKYNEEVTNQLNKTQSELSKLTDLETELTEEKIARIAEIESFKSTISSIRIKQTQDIEISAKRALMIQYADNLMAAGLDFDNEIIKELQDDYSHLIDAVAEMEEDPKVADSDEGIKLYNERNKIGDILEYAEQHNKLNSLYEKLKTFEIDVFGFNGPISFFEVLQDNIDFLGNNVEVKSDFIRSEVQLAQIKKAKYVIKAVKSIVAAMNSTK